MNDDHDNAQLDRDVLEKVNSYQYLLSRYMEAHLESARDWRDDLGYSCDERGCFICNMAGDDQLADAAYWIDNAEVMTTVTFMGESYTRPIVPSLPSDEELEDYRV